MDIRIILAGIGFLIWAAHQKVTAHVGAVPLFSGSVLALIAILLGMATLAVLAVVIRIFIRDGFRLYPRTA